MIVGTDAYQERQIKEILGDDGLALIQVVAELTKKLATGVPEGYGIEMKINRLDRRRDEVTVIVSKRHSGTVEFVMRHDGEKLELYPVAGQESPWLE